jgi:Zn-dependent peptidase ImmA (M78 family)
VAEDLELPDSAISPPFSLDQRLTADALGDQLRTALRMDLISKSVLLQPEVLLRELVRRVEELNVTVIQVQRVEVSEMRGFSLGDGTCPIVALNGADWPRGKIYTLLHELAHVGFRSNGLCDLQRTQDLALERRCDAVAAAALMPASPFLAALGSVSPGAITQDFAKAVGNEFGASGEAALLRMVELDRANWDDYWRLKPGFEQAYAAFKAEENSVTPTKMAPFSTR